LKLPTDIKTCHEIILAQQEMIQQLLEQNSLLRNRVEQLEAKVKELETRLNQDSNNSHRPPSSEGLRKKPALPRKKGKKQGGQTGHKGKTLDMVETPDNKEPHAPIKCSCGRDLTDVPKQIIERRQVFDLPQPKLEVTEHQLQSCICPDCQSLQVGQFPQSVPARVQYGAGVRSLVVLLNNSYKLSYSNIRQFFSDVFGYDLNESTQTAANAKCYEALGESELKIKEHLLASAVNHFDETGLRVAGKLHWLHNCSNEGYTYLFVHPKRGKKALDDTPSLIPDYQGWAVHDCWASYFKYDQCRHAICGAHLLRELQALIEQGSHWADRMRDLLLYAYTKSDEGKSTVHKFDRIERQYDRICKMADAEEPPPKYRHEKKRPKKTKGRNLMDRLVLHKDAVLAFAKHKEIPFTNNQAERDVRPAKIKQKMAGCFRTFQGAQVYARIQSFISTVRKHQHNVFNELVATFSGDNFLTAPGGC
jgi:transposase